MSHELTKLTMKAAVICTLSLAGCQTASESSTIAEAPRSLSSTPATLTVNVSGFKSQQGAVMAALVDAEGYKGGKPLRGAKVNVEGETLSFAFEGLPPGEYAIRMYHDINNDGDMNTNAFGMPTEPFAFSNNATGTMGPAPWSKAKFTVTSDTVQNISF